MSRYTMSTIFVEMTNISNVLKKLINNVSMNNVSKKLINMK